MALTNLIDLIAEVAAKRTTREGRTKPETPEQAGWLWQRIAAILGHTDGWWRFVLISP